MTHWDKTVIFLWSLFVCIILIRSGINYIRDYPVCCDMKHNCVTRLECSCISITAQIFMLFIISSILWNAQNINIVTPSVLRVFLHNYLVMSEVLMFPYFPIVYLENQLIFAEIHDFKAISKFKSHQTK